ncbi:MAG: hypothetical protein KBF37_06010 [Saprospiraceae bacterium]|jgi:hypothetical protein|nr:hypothetical protein [Saprospiraceae bacterium]MBP9209866.1 hypothetical protein [Saprospiraceae bacterium]MBV6473762.1 hypothetical protein [Saprospiraceae bacterium]
MADRQSTPQALRFIDNPVIVALLCLTLGLAPFYPEPHIWGKIRWVMGGANGMTWMDWLDLFYHGIPWLLALRLVIRKMFFKP